MNDTVLAFTPGEQAGLHDSPFANPILKGLYFFTRLHFFNVNARNLLVKERFYAVVVSLQ